MQKHRFKTRFQANKEEIGMAATGMRCLVSGLSELTVIKSLNSNSLAESNEY